MADVEREHIRRTLEHTFGNQSAAARLLKLDRNLLRAQDEAVPDREFFSAFSLAAPVASPRCQVTTPVRWLGTCAQFAAGGCIIFDSGLVAIEQARQATARAAALRNIFLSPLVLAQSIVAPVG